MLIVTAIALYDIRVMLGLMTLFYELSDCMKKCKYFSSTSQREQSRERYALRQISMRFRLVIKLAPHSEKSTL